MLSQNRADAVRDYLIPSVVCPRSASPPRATAPTTPSPTTRPPTAGPTIAASRSSSSPPPPERSRRPLRHGPQDMWAKHGSSRPPLAAARVRKGDPTERPGQQLRYVARVVDAAVARAARREPDALHRRWLPGWRCSPAARANASLRFRCRGPSRRADAGAPCVALEPVSVVGAPRADRAPCPNAASLGRRSGRSARA